MNEDHTQNQLDKHDDEDRTIDQILPIDEIEEEVSENGQKVRKRGIYILPNLFTTAALFAGFFAIVSAMNGSFHNAAIAIFAAMIFDMFDGRVARMTNTQSRFGAEFDSLSDMVSFGVAPALAVFSWALSSLGKIGWAAAFIYVAASAIRLARFNTQLDVADKNYFTGLASPSAAALLAGAMWVGSDLGWHGNEMPDMLSYVMAILTALVGLLMISNVQYMSFKGLSLKDRVPFVAIFIIVLFFALLLIDPPVFLLCAFSLYALSGPVLGLFKAK